MINKKIYLTLILGIFLISFISASTIYEKDKSIDLKVICLNNGFCSSSAFCTINIISPNSSLIVTGQNMTNQVSFHNYTITPTEIGNYCVSGFCKDGSDFKEINFCFTSSKSNSLFTTADSILSVLIIILTFILSVVFIWLAIILPISNDLDEKGNIVKINYFKYFKIFSIWFAHVFLAYFLTTFLGIMNNYYTLEITINLVEFLYRVTYVLLYPMTIIILSLLFIFSFKDILWNKQIREHGKAFITKTN